MNKVMINNLKSKISLLINPEKNTQEVKDVINDIEKLVNEYSKDITYTQIRNLYGIITETHSLTDLHRIRHRIAYIQAKQVKSDGKKFVEFIVEIIKTVNEDREYKEFKNLMETIVAYFKLYGKN